MSRPTSRNVCCDYSYSSESTVGFTKGLLFLPGLIMVIYSVTADQKKKLLTWSFRSVIQSLGLDACVRVKSSVLQVGSCKELEPGGTLAVGASVWIQRWGQLVPPWLIFSLIPPTQLQPVLLFFSVQGLPLKRGSPLVLKFGVRPWAATLDHPCGVTRGFRGAKPARLPGEGHAELHACLRVTLAGGPRCTSCVGRAPPPGSGGKDGKQCSVLRQGRGIDVSAAETLL